MVDRMSRRQHPVAVHIDELVLDGLDAGAADGVRDAIARELGRLGVAADLAAGDIRIDAVDAGTFDPSGGADAAGTRVADAIQGARKR